MKQSVSKFVFHGSLGFTSSLGKEVRGSGGSLLYHSSVKQSTLLYFHWFFNQGSMKADMRSGFFLQGSRVQKAMDEIQRPRLGLPS